jgi:hypothetical protein
VSNSVREEGLSVTVPCDNCRNEFQCKAVSHALKHLRRAHSNSSRTNDYKWPFEDPLFSWVRTTGSVRLKRKESVGTFGIVQILIDYLAEMQMITSEMLCLAEGSQDSSGHTKSAVRAHHSSRGRWSRPSSVAGEQVQVPTVEKTVFTRKGWKG